MARSNGQREESAEGDNESKRNKGNTCKTEGGGVLISEDDGDGGLMRRQAWEVVDER